MNESRTRKTFLNARVNFIFYFLTLILAFVSRKFFLTNLGDDFIGLTGTLSSILNFLNLAELGIGTSIAVLLYKPIFDKDKDQINEIISVFGYVYSIIGRIILFLGIIISCFLPLIFEKSKMPYGIIFFAYYSYLTSSLLSYFSNYKQILLSADQRNYVVTAYYQTSMLVKNIGQLILCYYTHNYYVWIGIELLFSIYYCILLNKKIHQVYPWFKTDIKLGRKVFKKYPEIVTKTKQVFVQRIAYVILSQTQMPLIYAFTTLQSVALYGNYMMLIERAASLVNLTMGGVNASIGNLIAENNQKKIISVFWELRAFRYWAAFVLIFSFYYFIEPFIGIWLGNDYILDKSVLVIILINIFIGQTRIVVMGFLNGYGLFKDIWSSVVETILNLGIAILLGYFYGLAGVLLGVTISLFLVIGFWKPYFLFKEGFHLPVIEYWKKTAIYLIISFLIWWLIDYFFVPYIHLNEIKSYTDLIVAIACLVPIYALITWVLYYYCANGMKNFSQRIYKFFIKKR